MLGLADLRFSGYEPKLVSPSAMIRRLRDTFNGPDENESHSGRPEESMEEPNSDPVDLQIIGQEMVSVSGNGKGKGNGHGGSSATSAELVPATPTRPTTRPTMLATEEKQAIEDRRVEGLEAPRGQETPAGLPHPIGLPQAYGPTPPQPTPGQEIQPLFDAEQLQRLSALQQQAQWIYGAQRGFGSFVPYIPRPAGLTEEEEKLAERRQLLLSEDQEQRLKRSHELELKINLMQKKVDELSAANEGIRIENEGIRRENEDLRRMVAARRDELTL